MVEADSRACETGTMSVFWLILGVIFLTVVLSICFVYFVVRPRVMGRVETGSLVLGQELHGREPLRSAPANCEGISDPERLGLKGLGAMGLTDQALVFGHGQSQGSVIIPLTSIDSVEELKSVEILTKKIRRPNTLLVVNWTNQGQSQKTIAWSVDDPAQWVSAIEQAKGNVQP